MHSVDCYSRESLTSWLTGAGYEAIISCPAPVDWSRPGACGAAVATPFTVAVDVVTGPVHALWILFTAGGHGDPWIPWCGD